MAQAVDPTIRRAEATTPHYPDMSSNQGSGPEVPSRTDVLLTLIAYEDLFADIDDHPEGDVRHRFLRIRSKRARYVESLVISRVNTLAALEHDVTIGKIDPYDNEVLDRYKSVMESIDEALTWISRVYNDDSEAANAPVVERHFMDHVHRYFLQQPGKGPRGPNGTMRSVYGSTGEPVSQNYMSLCDGNNDFFHRLILDKLVVPFNKHIIRKIQKRCYQWLGRDATSQTQGMSGNTLDVLVAMLECISVGVCFAASVVLVYNLKTTKDRIIAASFACFACVFPVMFLSKEAKSMFTLAAGIWAVLIVVVLLSVADLNGKANSG